MSRTPSQTGKPGVFENELWKLDSSVIAEEVADVTTEASSSEFVDDMAIAERVMDEDREVLRTLADS